MFGNDATFDPKIETDPKTRTYNENGYTVVTLKIISYMKTLIKDPDMDVRKAASDGIATLALYIRPEDIPRVILSIPLQLVQEERNSQNNVKKNPNDNSSDDLCTSASHLLADIASLSPIQVPPEMVSKHIAPTVVGLCKHGNVRVRRAAVQALPSIVAGSSLEDVKANLLPAFAKLSQDDAYRVRKGVGECLVDMSRSLMLLAKNLGRQHSSSDKREQLRNTMREIRRSNLVPLCTRLLQDGNRVVRHGMMQFLGPFIASFYPLDGSSTNDQNDGIVNSLKPNNNKITGGMGAQFFPHANGMVTRLNPESISSPVTMPGIIRPPIEEDPPFDSEEYLESLIPAFLEKCHNDAKSLVNILRHRAKYPTAKEDIEIVEKYLLPPYAGLASMNTGDENVDAEMRVYCAYSLPAVVLLLGKDGWDKSLKNCFLILVMGTLEVQGSNETTSFVPPPVKRCLASSFHTICNILGPDALKATSEERKINRDLLSVFEACFLRDSDETVRLNVIRNLPSFLSLLPFSKRSSYLPILNEIIRSDSMLAMKRKNASNPAKLNWRQRDMVAQILPNLISLYRPDQVRQYLWPIIRTLLSDSVNLVRENTEWSIPILLKTYEYNNCLAGREDANMASKFSQESCNEIYLFLKENLLDYTTSPGRVTNCGAFSRRQSYCRILSAIALVLRLHELKNETTNQNKDEESIPYPPHPFYTLSPEAYKHIHHLLRTLFLPPALAMKDDRVTNVRLTLAKCLRVMPLDIRDRGDACVILRTLEDEIETWEGGGGLHMKVELPKIKSEEMTSMNEETSSSRKNQPIISSRHMEVDEEKSGEDDSMSLASI